MRAGLALALAIAGSLACGSKRQPPPSTAAPADAAPTLALDAAPPPVDAAAPTALRFTFTAPVPACLPTPSVPTAAAAALAAGRAAAKANRWADAVAALTRAQADRPTDIVIANQLALALLMAGDLDRAYQAAAPGLTATNATLAAAAHDHAGRAAEAMGLLDVALDHYTRSVALRPDHAVQDRLDAVTDVVPRPLARRPAATACVDRATADAVCTCLAALATTPAGPATCTWATPARDPLPTDVQVALVESAADRDSIVAATALIVVVRRRDLWSALTHVAVAPAVDLDETPNAMSAANLATVTLRGPWLIVATTTTLADTGAGERDVDTETDLSICHLPATGAPTCFDDLPVAQWTYQTPVDADTCPSASGLAFSVDLTPDGVLTKLLLAGSDPKRTAGRYLLEP